MNIYYHNIVKYNHGMNLEYNHKIPNGMTGRSPAIESSSPLLPFSPTSATGWSLSCISVILLILLYGKALYSLLFVLYRCIIVTFYIWSHNSFLFAEHELEYVILDWINMQVNHNLADIERLICVALKENLHFRFKPHILFSQVVERYHYFVYYNCVPYYLYKI